MSDARNLEFRALNLHDAEAFLSIVQTNRRSLLPWVTTPNRVHTLDDSIRELSIVLSDGSPARYGAIFKGNIVAAAKVMELGNGIEEIGVWRVAAYSGFGIGGRLVQWVAQFRRMQGTEEIVIRHHEQNIDSRNMAARLGAHFINTVETAPGERMLVYRLVP